MSSAITLVNPSGESLSPGSGVTTLPPWPGLLVGGVAAAVILVITVARVLELRLPAEEAATRRLSRALGLQAEERRALRRLAALPGSPPPSALLVSAHALRRAADRLARTPGLEDHVPAARALALRVGGLNV